MQCRQKLLAFSLCYCPGPTVEDLLKARLLLELQEVYQRLDLPAEEWFSDSKESTPGPVDNKGLPSSGSGDSIKSDEARENSWDIVGYTAGTTRSVLTTLGSAEFWKGKVRNIANISGKKSSHGPAVYSSASNHELRSLGVPAFYESLHEAAYIGKVSSLTLSSSSLEYCGNLACAAWLTFFSYSIISSQVMTNVNLVKWPLQCMVIMTRIRSVSREHSDNAPMGVQ